MRNKIIRVSDTEYALIKTVAEKLEKCGVENLPKEIKDALSLCPKCGGMLNVTVCGCQCSKCGYKRGNLNINFRNVTMGSSAAIGAMILARLYGRDK